MIARFLSWRIKPSQFPSRFPIHTKSTPRRMSEVTIDSFEPLKQEEAKYVKPFRLQYTQNEKKKVWECTKIHDSVSVILYNKTRDVILFVKQFRPAVMFASRLKDPNSKELSETTSTGYTLEMCAGILDKDHLNPKQVAKEEILEETGYDVPVDNIQFISSFRSAVGSSGSEQYLFYCQIEDNQKTANGGGVGDEVIEVVEMKVEEAEKLLYVKDGLNGSESRPVSMLFALSWFVYKQYPLIKN